MSWAVRLIKEVYGQPARPLQTRAVGRRRRARGELRTPTARGATGGECLPSPGWLVPPPRGVCSKPLATARGPEQTSLGCPPPPGPSARPLDGLPLFSIRTATAADADVLAELGTRTFYETFAKDNTSENMALYLAEHFGGALQRAELQEASVCFLLVFFEERASGYVKLRKGGSSARGLRPLEVCRFYVDKALHGKGAARELMAAIDALAQRDGHDALWLAVWQHNLRAIRFYEKHGFVRAGEQSFTLGRDVQMDWLMEKKVTPARSR